MSGSTISKENSKSEIQEEQLKSVFKERPKVDGVSLKFFGTLSSLASLALMNQVLSRSDVGKQSHDSISDPVNSTFFHQQSAYKNEPFLSVSGELEETKPVATFRNRNSLMNLRSEAHLKNFAVPSSSLLKLKCNESKVKSEGILQPEQEAIEAITRRAASVASLIQNFKHSINLFKAKNVLTVEEHEQLNIMEDELLANLEEFKEIRSHVQKLTETIRNTTPFCPPSLNQVIATPCCCSDSSVKADTVQRVIVCEAARKSVPRVLMCDDNFEVMSFSCDMDSESSDSASKSLSSDRPININSREPDHKFQIQLEINQEYIEVENSDCSFLGSMSGVSPISPHQRALALSGGADEVISGSSSTQSQSSKTSSTISHITRSNSNNETILKDRMNSLPSKNVEFPLQESSNHSEKALYYQPPEHFHTCCLANIPNLFSDSCDHSRRGSDYVEFPSLANTSNSFPNSCQHVPSERSSVSPQSLLSNPTESLGQFTAIKNDDSCKARSIKSNIHEDSRTILKSLSKDYKDTKKSIQLKTLGEENETLMKELRRRDVQILNLKKKINCLQFKEDLKSKTDGSFEPQSTHLNRDEKLYELSNSISNIQRNIDVYCSCFDGDHCNLEKQLQDMENDVSRIKRDLNAMKSERFEVKAAQQSVKDSNQVMDENCEGSDKSEAGSFRKVSEEFNCRSSRFPNDCPCHKLSEDNPFSPCGTDPSKMFPCTDVQMQLYKVNRQNEWLLKSMRESIVSESELSTRICNLETLVLALKERLRNRCHCEKQVNMQTNLNQLKCLNCANTSSRQGSSTHPIDSSETGINELKRLLRLRNDEISQLAQDLCRSEAARTELVNTLECKSHYVKELEDKLKNNEAKVLSLENELSASQNEVCNLQNQLSCCEKRVSELEEQPGGETSETNLQICENKIRELEDKLESTGNTIYARECTIKEMEEEIECYQSQIIVFHEQMEHYETTIGDLRKKLESCENKFSETETKFLETEKQLESSHIKICILEDELKKNEGTIGTLSGKLLSLETKIEELQKQLQNSQDKIDLLQKELDSNASGSKGMEENQSVCANQVAALQQQLQCAEEQLCGLMCERDSLLKSKQEAICEVKELKRSTKKLESANYCLAKEIAAEVERLKVDLMVKLHNFCPLITSLEMTRAELLEALALFEDAEKRCCSLNQKLNQTNEELQALKAMKQSASKSSKLLHRCSEKSLENQLLLSEACEDLSVLNDEKVQLKCAVESLMSENEEKDKQLSQALREMEDLRKEICHLRTLSEEKK